jgi:hypothetical protein
LQNDFGGLLHVTVTNKLAFHGLSCSEQSIACSLCKAFLAQIAGSETAHQETFICLPSKHILQACCGLDCSLKQQNSTQNITMYASLLLQQSLCHFLLI